MKLHKFSPTYVNLLDLLFRMKPSKGKLSAVNQEGAQYSRIRSEVESIYLSQDFFMNASDLFAMCTPHEWYLCGMISSQLKQNNAFWLCPETVKRSSSSKKAIKTLIRLNVLVKTETTDIYLVNPVYIRRGNPFTVLNTTASLIQDARKVTADHIVGTKTGIEEYIPLLNVDETKLLTEFSSQM